MRYVLAAAWTVIMFLLVYSGSHDPVTAAMLGLLVGVGQLSVQRPGTRR
jgi:hypothetical protein